MSWMRESSFRWYHHIFARILKCGDIPQHVAFIMDGNRRFAKKMNVEKFEGHIKGFDKLSETLQWCLDIGIHEVTVYAFSIENFKRPKQEVDGLMDLAREKFNRLLGEKKALHDKGVRIKIIGDISLLPDDLIDLVNQVESMTENNDRAFLNVAFSYTSQDEMTKGVNKLTTLLNNGDVSLDEVSLYHLSQCMYNPQSKPPDIIIRTSGESRLSDFLLFQGSYSYIEFTNALWPELSVWDLFWIVFKYQHAVKILKPLRNQELAEETQRLPSSSQVFVAA